METQHFNSTGKYFAIRLGPHEDLKKSILHFANIKKIKAGIVSTCVGSLEECNIRYANQKESVTRKGHYEIVSLTGTFSDTSCHLHISISDEVGGIIGGHLMDNNIVYTTAEVVLMELSDLQFDRELDPTYNFKELVVKLRV